MQRESPHDFAKYILSVSHSPLVISHTHRCTIACAHTRRQQISGRSGLSLLLFSPPHSQVFIALNRCRHTLAYNTEQPHTGHM